ncbi:MFS domain-containing protein [Mycena indigotica]|uniref:MFS domain-containing protein n=1 Tax=Mycena indigotica TaxID=2126181 RepID=A0A8H6STJ0_9AGAR|nr:MFS domain-containing protein [Mycena indigotica]KAF7303670.1 MFS domain-containing protein [Mycena indigotica]
MTERHEKAATGTDAQMNETADSPSPSTTPGSSTPDSHQSESFSIYTTKEKWFIVALIGYGGLFSPLSSNIYFPVIPALSQVFGKSIELINLTVRVSDALLFGLIQPSKVTMYIVFQALAPMFWGTLADSWGRRPMFIACLILLSVSCVGLALVPPSAYWLLLLLRCVQAAGSASTIALGAGVIGDISEPAERGGFFGVYNIGPLAGPAIGPVLGGALADGLGWRAIFWFLCIASAACAVVLILLLPETLRSIVGNGSIIPGPISRPILPLLGRKHRKTATSKSMPRKPFKNPLLLLLNVDIFLLLFFNGVICAVFYGVNTSISTIFHETYPSLSQTKLGLCYLAIGGGMLVGSATCGKLLDWDYQRVKRGIIAAAEARGESRLNVEGASFPIEKARIRLMPFLVALYVAMCAAYGWCIQEKVSIAGPVILLIGVGFLSMAVMNATQTLILDLVPDQGSSVTACNNLIRCALSAAMVAVIQLIIDAIDVGWTYVLLAGLCIAASPLMWVVMIIGPRWRERRRKKAQSTQ